MTITQITFVGQVRSITPQATNVTVKIDDGTGQIDVKKWIDLDKPQDADPGYEIDSHVRVWGRLKSFSKKKHVIAHVIRPVSDFNEVNYHMLEATAVHLFFTKGPLAQDGRPVGGGGGGGGEDSMFVDGGAGARNDGGLPSELSTLSPTLKKVYRFIDNAKGSNQEGVHLNIIASTLSLSAKEAMSATAELERLGIIYTTEDDETWTTA